MRAETMDRAIIQLDGNDAAAASFVVHDQIDGEKLDEELGGMPQRLPIHGMEHGMTGTVGGSAGALRDPLAIVCGHAAERALIDLSVVRAARTAAPNVRARKPPRAHCGRDIRWRPGRRANRTP